MLGNKMKNRNAEKGSALVYILIAIALLAALTVSFMEPSSQQTQSQNTFKLTSELEAQVDFIRTAVQECVVLHGGGDGGIDNISGMNTIGANKRFPIDPRADRLTDASTETKALVKELGCPGSPGDTLGPCSVAPFENPCPQSPTALHEPIFSGNSGKFMPPSPALFGEWQWYNGVDGVFFWISSDKTDAYIETALEKLDERFGDCEADMILNTSSSAVNITNNADVECPSKSACFVMWMITHKDADLGATPPRDKSKFTNAATCPVGP